MLGGLIGRSLGKRGNTVAHISNNFYNTGMIQEKDTDDEEATYLKGFSIGCDTDYKIALYPYRALNPCTIMPLMGSGLLPVESTNSRTGMLTCVGGLGIPGNIHGGQEVYANGKRLATEEYVVDRLSHYSTTAQIDCTPPSYVKHTSLSTTFNDFASNTSLSTTLGNYYNKVQIDLSLALKQNLISVSSPLTLGLDGKSISIDLRNYYTKVHSTRNQKLTRY